MKLRLFTFAAFTLLLLSGCSEQSAKDHGQGISVEMSDSLNIMQMKLTKYVNGIDVFDENVINADSSAFEKGQVIWFDVSPAEADATVKISLSYSKNLDGSSVKTTQKIDISDADEWVNVQLTDDYQLQLIELD